MKDYIYKVTSYDNQGETLLSVGITNIELVGDVLKTELSRLNKKELSILHLTIEYIPVYNEEYE